VSSRRLLVGILAMAALTFAGCAKNPVNLTSPPDVSAADQQTCNAFLGDLPNTLGGQERRKVNPAAALGRAWGDPPIIVRCGVGKPAGFDDTASCQQVSGVGWYVPQSTIDDQGADVVFTAVGYEPRVEVDVPAKYRPEGAAAAVAELAQPVKAHLKLVQACK
jgi:hypothetical protein